MSPEVLTLASSTALSTGVGTLIAVAAAAGAAFIAAPKVARRVMPQAKETRLSAYLPFREILPDGMTVVGKDNMASRFIMVGGVDQSFLKAEEAVSFFKARKSMFDALMDYGAILRIYTWREPITLAPDMSPANKVASEIASRWNDQFKRAYVSKTVIGVSIKGAAQNPKQLDEACTIIEQTLRSYGPVMLTQNPARSPDAATTLGSFLGRLVSPISQPCPTAFGEGLNEALAADEVEFLRSGRIRFRSGEEEKYASIIGIRRFGDASSTALSNELAAIVGEIMVLQTVEIQNKAKALITLKQNQKMMAATSFSSDVWDQFEAAIQMVEGLDEDRASLCAFSETVIVYGESEDELKALEKSVRQAMTNNGITSVVERGATQVSWWLQFPGFELKPRSYRLLSTNVALLASFDRPPAGLPRSSWGEGPVQLFYTGANSVYSHQFHISVESGAVGHGVCIAPTGAGKTTLMQMFSCMSSRHRNLRQFFFDRHQGTYIYTAAMGGNYLSFNAPEQHLSIRGGMNPFQCEKSTDNTEFLKLWLQAISGQKDADSIDQISNAVEMAFENLSREERSLAAILDSAFTPNSPVRRELGKWADPAQYGAMFNAERDCIDLEEKWLTSFDMTNLLNDDVLGAATVSYIMHRIKETLRVNRAPGFLFVDETEPLLRNDDFRKMYLVMLQEFRKLDAVVISVFQRPEALRATNVTEAVRQNSGAFYLFPNPGATALDYAEFDLTDRELGFILGETQPARRIQRGLLIKRPMTRESVIVDVDLSPLGPYLKLFSSSSKDVALANDLQRQLGARWVERIIDHEAP